MIIKNNATEYCAKAATCNNVVDEEIDAYSEDPDASDELMATIQQELSLEHKPDIPEELNFQAELMTSQEIVVDEPETETDKKPQAE